jgi:cytochrome P450
VREVDEEQSSLDDDEIVDELITLLVAGHESSTVALSWAFHWLLGDAALAARLRDEARGAGAQHGLDHDTMDRLELTGACVQEVLRIVPIIPIVPRLLQRDATIGDMELPAGTYVAACPYLTHRDPAVFSDPERFAPERFMGKRVSPFEFHPFGGGHRHCVGAAFATYEMAAIVAGVLARARLRRVGAGQLKIARRGILLAPADGTTVVLEERIS